MAPWSTSLASTTPSDVTSRAASAFFARGSLGTPAGGLLFSLHHHPTYAVRWFVVAERFRSKGLGEALLAEAFCKWVRPPCRVEVVSFGPDHPGARARHFHERLGFRGAEPAQPGPEGGSRQMFRMRLDRLPGWAEAHGTAAQAGAQVPGQTSEPRICGGEMVKQGCASPPAPNCVLCSLGPLDAFT